MPEVSPEVQPDLTADAPNPNDFDSYVARRQAESSAEPQPEVTDPPATEPELPASETGEPETPAAEFQPETPAPASEPGTETQEETVEREKKAGIPQSRFDEVTKARREAERDRDSATERAAKLERELAELKAKPAPAAPAPAAEAPPEEVKPRPVMPDPPALEKFDGDWDAYQAAQKEYLVKTLPDFQEQLTDWKLEQRENAQAKATKEREQAAARTQAEAAQKAEREAEEQAKTTWEQRFTQAKTDHPGLNEKIGTVPASPAMIEAIQHSDDGIELMVWLADHPEESKRIAELTGLDKKLTNPEMRRAVGIVQREFAKLPIEAPASAPPAQPTKPPENPKPVVSRAPKPPAVINERAAGASDPKTAAAKGDFDAYERLRMAQITRR